ncbi:MAG: hypothetical protein EZS28_048956 [Streblomastix strix]|uniref:Uncharacterized protein n=1 Tax=Streblomastix strix TaxID=222440 RepID=A0A5J4TB77_9EUKA|nr:MAG: hypothetical protein EZS28_048956 [Streblomastix strix]
MAPPYPYNQTLQYYNQQQLEVFPRGERENSKACGEEDAVVDVHDSKLMFKRTQIPSQYARITYEQRRKSKKTHPYH